MFGAMGRKGLSGLPGLDGTPGPPGEKGMHIQEVRKKVCTQRISNLMFYAKSAGRYSYIRVTRREVSHKDMHRRTSGTEAYSCRGQVQRCACREVKDKVAKIKDKGAHTSRIQKQSKRCGGKRDFYRLSGKVKHACACNKYTCSTFSWLFVFFGFCLF